MGTNYFVNADPTCDNPSHVETLHIGKSSGGWKFAFHGIPDFEPPLTSWQAWQGYLDGRTIHDEYGTEMTLEEFRPVVEDRMTSYARSLSRPICRVDPTPQEVRVGFGGMEPDGRGYHDPEGYDFRDGEFF